LIRLEIHEHYFIELGKCRHYEMKCAKYEGIDQEKYEKYLPKYLHHKKMAGHYYAKMKENAIYSDFIGDESIFADSRYFNEIQES
jgi:hypothetical protein